MKSIAQFEGYNIHIDMLGYPRIWVRGKGLVLIHRLIAKRVWGDVVDNMDVHHRDGDKMNWSPDNLQVLTHQEHMQVHRKLNLAAKGLDPETQAICTTCKRVLPKEQFCADRKRGDGRARTCRECALEISRRHRERGGQDLKDRINQKRAELMLDPEYAAQQKAKAAAYYLAKREQILARQKAKKLEKKLSNS